jgi:GGDEF domain-containing protein
MRDGAVLSRLSEKLGEVIVKTIRSSDVVCRYGKGQYLVLLMNTTAENCGIVEERINKKFRAVNQRNKIEYHASVVTYDPFAD